MVATIAAAAVLAFVVTRLLLSGPAGSTPLEPEAGLAPGGPIVVTEAGGAPAVAADSFRALRGVEQDANRLGSADAPVVLVEFEDLQCVACRQYDLSTSDRVATDLVATGTLQVRRYSLTFIGPDSVPAARWAYAAGRQDRMWQFVRAFNLNAGTENSGYGTAQHLREVAALVPGLDVDRAARDADSDAAGDFLDTSRALAAKAKVTGTPSLLMGRDLDHLQPVALRDVSDYPTIRDAAGVIRRGGTLPSAPTANQCSTTASTCQTK